MARTAWGKKEEQGVKLVGIYSGCLSCQLDAQWLLYTLTERLGVDGLDAGGLDTSGLAAWYENRTV